MPEIVEREGISLKEATVKKKPRQCIGRRGFKDVTQYILCDRTRAP